MCTACDTSGGFFMMGMTCQGKDLNSKDNLRRFSKLFLNTLCYSSFS